MYQQQSKADRPAAAGLSGSGDARIEQLITVYDEQAAALRRTALGLYEMRVPSLAQDTSPVELIVGDSALRSRYDSEYQQVRHGVRSLVRRTSDSPRGPDPEDRVIAALGTGIQFQAIVGPESLDDPAALAATMAAIRAGAQARSLPAVPVQMTIFDSAGALIAVPERGPHGHIFVSGSPLLDGLIAIFSALWQVATPLPQPAGPAARRSGRATTDRMVLTLLAAGATDAAIARHLGISLRTAQRRIRDVMSALGAETRFQAGLQAARKGWI